MQESDEDEFDALMDEKSLQHIDNITSAVHEGKGYSKKIRIIFHLNLLLTYRNLPSSNY